MAGYTYNATRVPLTGSTGNGAKMKKAVEALLELVGELSVVEVSDDTADVYSAYVSWKENADWGIRLFNSNGNACVQYFWKDPATGAIAVNGSNYNAQCTLTYDTITVDAVKYGDDLLVCSFSTPDKEGTSGTVGFWCFKVTDQFTKEVSNLGGIGGATANSGFPMNTSNRRFDKGGLNAEWTYTKNVNGLTPNGQLCAVPIVFHTSSATLPLSGFVGGGTLLYEIYEGTTRQTYSKKMTRFTLGGHEFVSLSTSLCLKIK